MDFTEIVGLRMDIARVLQIDIFGPDGADSKSTLTADKLRLFVQDHLGGWEKGSNSKVFGYSIKSAHSALTAILSGQPYWSDDLKSNNAKFEMALVKYLNNKKIPELGLIPTKIFRSGFNGAAGSFATDEMIAEGRDVEYIVSRLFDLCGGIPIGSDMLGSKRVGGIFIVAVVRVAPPTKGPLSIGSITFADFFEPTLEFDADSIKFGECEVRNVTRINPSCKPYMSDEDFSQFIYRMYRLNLFDPGNDDSFHHMKKIFLQNCICVLAKITLKYLEPMQKLMNDSIGTGSLPRVLLDVQHGVLLARQCDQGRFWVLCLSPIEGMKHISDELFGKEIVGAYEQAIERARKS